MKRMTILAAASAMTLALAACDEGNRARVDAPDPAPLAELTTESADLPFADPAPVEVQAPDESYAWAERAYGLQRAVYDTPPDYGFVYEDVEPLVWETEEDWALYAEPWEGDYRYYYYEPGAAYPYFVRDDDYGYAFSAAGILIAMFDSGGRYLPDYEVRRHAPLAGRYYVRGRDLRNAGLQSRRIPITEQVWVQQAPRVIRTADPWLRAAREERQWRAWRERNSDRELARFERETRRREAAAHQWRQRMDRRDFAEATRAEQRRAEVAKAERREARREAAERRDRQAERSKALQAEEKRDAAAQRQQAKAEQQRQAQAQQPKAKAQQQRQAQAQQQKAKAEQQRQAQAQQQKAKAQQPRQAQAQQQKAKAEQQRQAQAQQQKAKAERKQARSAAEQGRPASARERGDDRGRGRPD